MDLLEEGTVVGQLHTTEEGLYTVFHAKMPQLGQELQAVYLIGTQGQQRLGILEKIGVGGDLQRRVSRQMLRPLGTITHGQVRLAQDTPWQPLTNHKFQSQYLQVQCRQLECGVWRHHGPGGQIAVPYQPGKAFSLMSLFCFFKDQKIGSTLYLVLTLDQHEQPVV